MITYENFFNFVVSQFKFTKIVITINNWLIVVIIIPSLIIIIVFIDKSQLKNQV